MLNDLRSLNGKQRSAVLASYLGWTLDAFDFFILVFVLKDVAHDFGTSVPSVAWSVFLTLAVRPVGALIFGRAADRYGRRPVLMVDVLLFSVLEFASGFAPNLAVFFVLRLLFGVAMGGEWGVGASLTMETIPARTRGVISGLLQVGYPSGFLLASIVYGLLYTHIGWRGMFIVGALPALLTLYIRSFVDESPSFLAERAKSMRPSLTSIIRKNSRLFVYAIALMTCFNFFSHGSMDLYPTYLQVQRRFDVHTVSALLIVMNIGAIFGGISFGIVSQRVGRGRGILYAALLSLPFLPLWAFSASPVVIAFAAFGVQFAVQGAWGIVPAYLNELSPSPVRASFPGFAYQIGNLIAASNSQIQTYVAQALGNDYSVSLFGVVATVALLLAVLAFFGPDVRHVVFAESDGGTLEPAT